MSSKHASLEEDSAAADSDRRPTAFVHVDLDGLWAVRRCYGLSGSPEQDDPVYSHALPALLELFDQHSIKATFFVVGSDARVTWKSAQLQKALESSHELANHSMIHDLSSTPPAGERLEEEVLSGQKALRDCLGIEARGYRAPGYGFSPLLLETLERLGFWYDASLFPTPWGALMRWIGRRISQPSTGAGSSYGSLRGWRAPLRSYRPDPSNPWRGMAEERGQRLEVRGQRPEAGEKRGAKGEERSEKSEGKPQAERENGIAHSAVRTPPSAIFEVPVSVSPRCRLPFHGGVGYLLGRRWVERVIGSLARSVGHLTYVIHGMDLVDGRQWDAAPGRAGRWFFGGTERERMEFFDGVCGRITGQFAVSRTDSWVEQLRKGIKKH